MKQGTKLNKALKLILGVLGTILIILVTVNCVEYYSEVIQGATIPKITFYTVLILAITMKLGLFLRDPLEYVIDFFINLKQRKRATKQKGNKVNKK
jgi:phage-related holin